MTEDEKMGPSREAAIWNSLGREPQGDMESPGA